MDRDSTRRRHLLQSRVLSRHVRRNGEGVRAEGAYDLFRHDDLDKDFHALKRFAAPKESLEAWERLFSLKGLKETPGICVPFPGFGNAKVYKGRVVPLKENVGKSKGYRVIFKLQEEQRFRILVFSRHGIYRDERDLINLSKSRLEC